MKHQKKSLLSAGLCLVILAAGCSRHTSLGLGLDAMSRSADTARVPSVRIETTVLPAIKLLSITYETTTEAEIGRLLNTGYIDLCSFVNLHRLPSNKVMAFYHTYKTPFILEAAVEVDSIPPVLTGNIQSRVLEGGEALILHYKGPYENASFAYHALDKWLQEHGKEAKGLPFEVYLNDPVTIRHTYQLKTDIYQFYK